LGFLIDTNVFIVLEREGLALDALRDQLSDEPIALASITASELLLGVHRANSPSRQLSRGAVVEQVLETVPVLPFNMSAARIHARIWADLLRAGQPIGPHDLIIAATALAHDHAVLTYNIREFERVPGLIVQQPAW
jgi:predicted nucleic acid-binding protein